MNNSLIYSMYIAFIQILYRVRWPNTWEKEANLNGCDALKNFENNIEQNDDDLTVTEAQDDEELWEVHQILQKTITNGKVMLVFGLLIPALYSFH